MHNYQAAPFSHLRDGGVEVEYIMDSKHFELAMLAKDFGSEPNTPSGEVADRLKALNGDYSQFSGVKPVDKAMGYGKFLKNYFAKEEGKSTHQKMSQALQKLKDIKDLQDEGLIPGRGTGEGGDPIQAEDLNPEEYDIEALKYLNQIRNLNTFKVGGESEKIYGIKGKREVVKMKNYSELGKVIPRDLALPDKLRKMAIVERKLRVEKRYIREMKHQELFLIIDASGSMEKNFAKLRAIFLYIKPGIEAGTTSLYTCYFETKPFHYRKAETIEEFEELYKDLQPGWLGATDVQNTLEKVEQKILKNKWGKEIELDLKNNPELVIINDGHDYVNGVGKFKTHCISLYQVNEGLKQLCQSSGGTYSLV